MPRAGIAILRVLLFVLLAVAALSPVSAWAQGRQFAVIVALDYNWASEDVRLRFTHSDADRFRRFLNAPELQVLELTDAPNAPANRRATRSNIMSALRSILARTKPGDTVWFYYSGHGKFLQGDNTSYLIPADVTRLDSTTGISVRELRGLLTDKTRNKARTNIVVLDACESGSARRWNEAGASPPLSAPLPEQSGIITFAAARPDRSAFEVETAPIHGGLFTYYLCAGLAGATATPANPQVTLEALQKYVTESVNAACERIGKVPQEPIFLAAQDDWKSVVVGAYRKDVLAQLKIPDANKISPSDATERPPLEPGMIVALAKSSVGVDDDALAYLKERLVDAGVPLLSDEATTPFLATLDAAVQGKVSALAEAERYNARFLLRVKIKSDLRPSPSTPGVTTGNVTMEVELLDVYGRLNAIVTDTAQARPSSQPEKALADAITKVSDKVLLKLKNKLPLKKQTLQRTEAN